MMKGTKDKNSDKKTELIDKLASNKLWVRKFDFDEEIVIGNDENEYHKYLMEEDEEIAMLLSSNTSAIE